MTHQFASRIKKGIGVGFNTNHGNATRNICSLTLLQCVAVSVLQWYSVNTSHGNATRNICSLIYICICVSQCVAVRCSTLQCVAMRRSVLQCVAEIWSAWLCVAVYCGELRSRQLLAFPPGECVCLHVCVCVFVCVCIYMFVQT